MANLIVSSKYDENRKFNNVSLMGMNGSEVVKDVNEALGMLNVTNPIYTLASSLPDKSYVLSELWAKPDDFDPGNVVDRMKKIKKMSKLELNKSRMAVSRSKEKEMNAMHLLCNAMMAIQQTFLEIMKNEGVEETGKDESSKKIEENESTNKEKKTVNGEAPKTSNKADRRINTRTVNRDAHNNVKPSSDMVMGRVSRVYESAPYGPYAIITMYRSGDRYYLNSNDYARLQEPCQVGDRCWFLPTISKNNKRIAKNVTKIR